MKNKETAVLILAAGASKRLGKPKQQLVFKEQTLLNRIIETAKELASGPVLVVQADHVERLEQEGIISLSNSKWEEGMASSIHCGIDSLVSDYPTVDKLIITVCDQPFITAELFREMIDLQMRTNQPMIACKYADTIGTPVLFHQSVFGELMALSGDKGARQLLKKDAQRVGLVNFPLGSIDIDTAEDYEGLIKL